MGLGRILIPLILASGLATNAYSDQTERWSELTARGDALLKERAYESALSCFDSALALTVSLPLHDSCRALSLHDLGKTYQYWINARNCDSCARIAIEFYERALDQWNKLGEKFEFSKSRTLSNLGAVITDTDESRARDLFNEALEIKLRYSDSLDLSLTTLYLNLSDLEKQAGNGRRALQLISLVCQIRENNPKTKCSDLANAYAKAGLAARDLNLVHEAAAYFVKASDAACPRDTMQKALYLRSLGVMYSAWLPGRQHSYLDTAASYIRESLQLLEDANRMEIADYALALMNLSSILIRQDRFDEAESLLAVAGQKIAKFPEWSFEHAGNVLRLQIAKGDAIKAESTLHAAEAVLTQDNEGYQFERRTLALERGRISRGLGDLKTSADVFSKSLTERLDFFAQFLPVLTESELNGSYQVITAALDELLTTLRLSSDSPPAASQLAIEALLRTGSYVVDEINSRRELFRERLATMSKPVQDSLQELAGRITQLKATAEEDKGSAGTAHELQEMLEEYDLLTRRIAGEGTVAGIVKSDLKTDLRSLQESLDDRTALVAYSFFAERELMNGYSKGARYVGAVITHDSEPRLVFLDEAESIDSLVVEYVQHMRRMALRSGPPSPEDFEQYTQTSDALYQAIWQPLETLVVNHPQVAVMTAGSVNRIPFASLIDNQGRFLVERHEFVTISSVQDMMNQRKTLPGNRGLLALADPELTARGDTGEASTVDQSWLPAQRVSTQLRGLDSPCLDFGADKYGSLQGARREVSLVDSLWRGQAAQSSMKLIGPEATERAFIDHCSGKSVLHLATHGFHLEECATESTHTEDPDESSVPQTLFARSGLLLAGAGMDHKEAHPDNDGVLSGLEVLHLDLSGVELVVLSACNSGLGEGSRVSGAYGLPRAFILAGARNVVTAMWKISDQFTPELMRGLYEKLQQPLPRRLRESQLGMIKTLKKLEIAPHPYLWSPFVVTCSQNPWRQSSN